MPAHDTRSVEAGQPSGGVHTTNFVSRFRTEAATPQTSPNAAPRMVAPHSTIDEVGVGDSRTTVQERHSMRLACDNFGEAIIALANPCFICTGRPQQR